MSTKFHAQSEAQVNICIKLVGKKYHVWAGDKEYEPESSTKCATKEIAVEIAHELAEIKKCREIEAIGFTWE